MWVEHFHGKGYLFKIGDQFDCLIGSSNLTASALTRNDERLNFHVTATSKSKVVQDFLENFDNNFNSADELSDELPADYTKKYEAINAIRKDQEQLLNLDERYWQNSPKNNATDTNLLSEIQKENDETSLTGHPSKDIFEEKSKEDPSKWKNFFP